MECEIVRGDLTHIDACKEALLDSELGENYFTEDSAAIFLAIGLSKGEIYICRDSSSQFLGCIWIDVKGIFSQFPYVRIIAVNRRYRGRGVGRKLLSYYEQIGFAKSSKLFILVGETNIQTKKLYTELGYQEIAMIPNLYKTGWNEFLMMKEKT